MPNFYDIAYFVGLATAAPIWLVVPIARRKVLKALRERMGRVEIGTLPRSVSDPSKVTVLIHAVSLGEINATRALIRSLDSARPDLRFVVTVTTDTGFARGRELYGSEPNVTLVRYPLDFSGAIRRLLDAFQPDAAVLMELEVWPNFVLHCHQSDIPVLLINGRLTTSSFRNYRRARALLAPTFRRLSAVCAQDRTYADRFLALGAPADRVQVTGTMKFDTAQIADHIDGQEVLAASLHLDAATGPIWVCGSTGPGEEPILLRCYRKLLPAHPALRLVLVPRHPERFDEVAARVRDEGFDLLRRSENRGASASPSQVSNLESQIANLESETPHRKSEITNPKSGNLPPVILGDTMGELRKFYSLAHVVFVGRSLVDLGPRQHGSDMIEPAALAKPVAVGPWTHNFADAMDRFREAGAMKIVGTEAELFTTIDNFLTFPAEADAIGRLAQEVVRRQRGATARHVDLILDYLED